ncbi:MAG: ABC transporter permease [Lachnospiraceae bacterium]|nr:ABC transporter permease [Lachnospiraceae bacterium]
MLQFFTGSQFVTSMELGLLYGLVALALYISFSLLNIADLSTDGCFTLGCAVCASVTVTGHPFLAFPAAMAVCTCSGFVTAFLQTRLGVQSILAGIIVNTGLYTINFLAMGSSANLNVFGSDTIFSLAKGVSENPMYRKLYTVLILLAIVLVICCLLHWFLNTTLGLSIRATGDNESMVKASSINPSFTITVGLCISSTFTGLSGALLAQYQKSCDINFGTGQVTIALASLMIGMTLVRRGPIFVRALGAVLGSCLYRLIVAIAMKFSMPAEFLKLASAIIVTVAICAPYVKTGLQFYRRRMRKDRVQA